MTECVAHIGRPRDPSRDSAIIAAALDLVARDGYDRVTIDAIALHCHVGKATIYRRWTSKADLIVSALATLASYGETPNTGSLLGDLRALGTQLTDASASKEFQVIYGLSPAIARDPELRNAFEQGFIGPRRKALLEILRRAVTTGEIPPDKDLELLSMIMPSVLMWRLTSGMRASIKEIVSALIDQVIYPAAITSSGRTHLS